MKKLKETEKADNKVAVFASRPLNCSTAAVSENATAASVTDLRAYRKQRDGFERTHRVKPIGKKAVKIEIDVGDFILKWQLTQENTSKLITLLRKASHLRESGELTQEFLHARRR